jgi:hypothetical protein
MAATDIVFNGLYHMVGERVAVTIGGLYCGTFVVTAPGQIAVPINSDPDGLCNGKYLQSLDVGPWDKTTYGALTCEVTLDIGGNGPATVYIPVAIGFNYPAMGQTMRPASAEVTKSPMGAATGKLKRIHAVGILGYFVGGKLGLQIGTQGPAGPVNACNVTSLGGVPLTHNQPFDGEFFMAVSDETNKDGQIFWQMLNPYPCVINTLNAFIEVGERS